MIKNRVQPKIANIGTFSIYIIFSNVHESDVSAIFAVFSNGVGMTNPSKNNMSGVVRINTIEKQKQKFSGVGYYPGTWLKPCTAQNNKYRNNFNIYIIFEQV